MAVKDSAFHCAVLFCRLEDSYRSADGIVADRSLTEAGRLMKVPASKQDLALTGETETALVCCTEAVRLGALAVAARLAAVEPEAGCCTEAALVVSLVAARSVAVEPEAGCCTEAALAVLLAAARLAARVDRFRLEGLAVWLVADRKKLVEQRDEEQGFGTDSKTNTVHLVQGGAAPGARAVDSLGLG